MIIFLEGEKAMERKQASKKVAKTVKTALNLFLRVDANSAASIFAYQPKAPKKLTCFKYSK